MAIDIIAIITALVSSVETWLPAVISIAGVIISVFVGFARIRRACNDIKSDTTINEIYKELLNDKAAHEEETRVMKLFLDKQSKIMRKPNNDDTGGEDRN